MLRLANASSPKILRAYKLAAKNPHSPVSAYGYMHVADYCLENYSSDLFRCKALHVCVTKEMMQIFMEISNVSVNCDLNKSIVHYQEIT